MPIRPRPIRAALAVGWLLALPAAADPRPMPLAPEVAARPDWTVYIWNRIAASPAPREGRYHAAVIRSGEGATDNPLAVGPGAAAFTGLASGPNGVVFGPGGQAFRPGWGFTGVQRVGDLFGIGIDSRSAKANLNAFNRAAGVVSTGALQTVVLARSLEMGAWRPWSAGGRGVRTAMALRMPHAGGTHGGGAQIVTYYELHDRRDPSKFFYLGAALYDTRPGALSDPLVVHADRCDTGCTGKPILNVPLRRASPYVTLLGRSAESSDGPRALPETRLYDFAFSAENVGRILGDAQRRSPGTTISGYSPDPADYDVTSWNLNPEVFYQTGPQGEAVSDGWIGLSGRMIATGPR